MKNRDITTIKPYGKNAKKHPDKQIKQVADSIQEFGFNQPIVVDMKGVVVVGHGRLEAAKLLGMTEVPCIELNLTEEQAKSYRLADNKLNESDWDMELLIPELKELSAPMFNLTGFSADLLIENEDRDDDVPEAPERSKLGDVYQIGKHRILCGDSTKIEDVSKLMDGTKADMVFTDPPYNVNYSGRGKETSNTIENDNMSKEAFDEFLFATFQAYKTATKISAPFYVCHSSSSQIAFEQAMAKTDLIVKNQIIWNKTIASMGWGDYRRKHEPIFYATYGKKKVKFYGDRREYTVWNESWNIGRIEKMLKAIATKQERGGSTVWTIGRDQNYKHPTQKPIELLIIALANSSKAEDIVLDLFLGSGSTLIGCEKSNRICYGMELDPKYIDVIVQRYVNFTGNTKVVKNGKIETWEVSE